MTWAEVNQAPIRRVTERPRVTLSLSPMRSTNFLWLTVSNQVAAQLGWQPGNKLALWVGHEKLAGWLKFAPAHGGRAIKHLGQRTQSITCPLLAPDEWRDLACAKTPYETWRVQGNALLVEIPWDFSEIETGTGPAGHEVYS